MQAQARNVRKFTRNVLAGNLLECLRLKQSKRWKYMEITRTLQLKKTIKQASRLLDQINFAEGNQGRTLQEACTTEARKLSNKDE